MSGIQTLELAEGIREHLMAAGYTIDTILKSNPSEISKALGIDQYVAKLIIDAAKRAAGILDFDESVASIDFEAAD